MIESAQPSEVVNLSLSFRSERMYSAVASSVDILSCLNTSPVSYSSHTTPNRTVSIYRSSSMLLFIVLIRRFSVSL